MQSKGYNSLPAVITGKEVIIQTDVVESHIPLLISQTAMKEAAIKLDFKNDTAAIMGKEVALNLTSSGHYCIPIDESEEVPMENVCAVKLEALSRKDRFKTLIKLHRQFAHSPMNRLIALLKDTGAWTEEYEIILAQIAENAKFVRFMPKLHQGH